MKKTIGILLFICIALSANAQLLWKISGNGLVKPSYIFGTHHLAPYSIMDSIKGLLPAFEEASQVIGELKMSEMQTPAAMQMMQQKMMMSGEGVTKDLFTPDEYTLVNTYVKENMKFDLAQIPKVKPAFITNNIVVLLYMKNVPDYNPQEQLDTYFQVKGAEKGKEIQALETMEFQTDLLFNTTPVDRQAELLVCTLSDISKIFKNTKRLTEAYMTQDLQTIQAISEEKEGTKCDPLPGEMEALGKDRNIKWMEKLPAMIKEKSSFIAVGAYHLIGDKGLVNLLKTAGYTVEPME